MNKLLLAALLAVPGNAHAGWVEDALLFAGGLAAGFVVHELGHELVARAYGEKMEWRGSSSLPTWECAWPCRSLDKTALAGNLSTAIVGEALLHTSYRNAFVDGMQAFNTVNPIRYAYYAKYDPDRVGYGDYRYVADGVQIALGIHAASIGYRHVASGKWRVGTTGRSVQLSINF